MWDIRNTGKRVRSRNVLLFLLPLLIQLLYPTAVAAKPNIVSVGLYVTTVGDVSCYFHSEALPTASANSPSPSNHAAAPHSRIASVM